MPRRGGVRRRHRRRRRRRILLVGGMVAFGSHKMSSQDADRIQEHTGTDPEELSDQELEQAMDELGIDGQQVTDQDREQGTAAATPTSEPASTPAESDYLDDLQKLADLHAAGVLTDEEFQLKKGQILDL